MLLKFESICSCDGQSAALPARSTLTDYKYFTGSQIYCLVSDEEHEGTLSLLPPYVWIKQCPVFKPPPRLTREGENDALREKKRGPYQAAAVRVIMCSEM